MFWNHVFEKWYCYLILTQYKTSHTQSLPYLALRIELPCIQRVSGARRHHHLQLTQFTRVNDCNWFIVFSILTILCIERGHFRILIFGILSNDLSLISFVISFLTCFLFSPSKWSPLQIYVEPKLMFTLNKCIVLSFSLYTKNVLF